MPKKVPPSATGFIGSVQFEGYGPNSGQAQIVLNRDTADERRFLLPLTDNSNLPKFQTALKYMWLGKPNGVVTITYKNTDNLPLLVDITAGALPGDAKKK